ncbi:hypothetical protein CCACVL1_01961 [Corchorus capsularis]|uniref:Uncharacterized protein n=1 Tax=Corchorus capsularis TaxID=210143 RepID=A0A1R3KE00_COCAP|nr:hypothetical protein CCACVL1_01961 [Corchorus capsularis]
MDHMIYESGFISETHQQSEEEMMDVRKGPWTDEEDSMLKAYVHIHGEGRWNSVARLSGQLSSSATATTATTYMDNIITTGQINYVNTTGSVQVDPSLLPELSGTSSDSQVSSVSDCYNNNPQQSVSNYNQNNNLQNGSGSCQGNYWTNTFEATEELESNGWLGSGDSMESVWNEENIWFLQQQLFDD